MRMLPSETLRQYFECYWQLFNEIPGIDEYWAGRSFKNGLESGSKILDELAIPPLSIAIPQLSAPISTPQSQPKKHINNIKEGKKRPPKEHNYVAKSTVFKEPIWSFLKEIMRQQWFEWLAGKLGTNTGQPDQNLRKKCSYHNELGHYTTACAPFKALLERLASQGHLDQYIDPAKTPARQPNTIPN
ncbi:uncharacterized protein LOC131323834 [Rhododendron vialii]|uniref:uncharacterized protein LOC131323834 n=1 Tax=Rhododendron vialii TaxID=182163 RepID=UPI00265E9A29|nr:uncharacterized protein LOC131323834 [Rhododendron vialii]